MSLQAVLLQPRFARNFGSSFRQPQLALEPSPSPNINKDAQILDDFVEISRDDLPIRLDSPPCSTSALPSSSQHPPNSTTSALSFLRRNSTVKPAIRPRPEARHSQSLLSRLRNPSQLSVTPRQNPPPSNRKLFARFSSRNKFTEQAVGISDIVDDFPEPPTHIPTPVASLYEHSSSRYSSSGNQSIITSVYSVDLSTQPTSPASSDNFAVTKPRRRPPRSIQSTTQSLIRIKTLAKHILETPVADISGKHPPALARRQLLITAGDSSPLTHKPPPKLPPPPPPVIELVNPLDLTASPQIETVLPSTRTSFCPPSPSWLSRNIPQPYNQIIEESPTSSPELSTPVSLPPLPIPPRVYISPAEEDIFTRIDNVSEHTLIGSVEGLHPSPAVSINSLSSNHSFLTPSEHSHNSDKENYRFTANSLFKLPHLLHAPNQACILQSRNSLDSDPESSSASPSPPSALLQLPPSAFQPKPDRLTVSIPSEPDTAFEPNLSALPIDLSLSLRGLCDEAGIPIETTEPRDMDYTGKRSDVVDFGGEINYEGIQWFQDPPNRPAPPEPVQQRHYEPPPQVIMQNESFEYALRVAPNVLFSRFKQYGQLGVLGWCSELAEMIDGLKELGFNGNMFVTTRTQALKACEEILALKLPIEMQIIVMYLSSQIARLRRFLDGDRQWDDYPEPSFPIDPQQYRS